MDRINKILSAALLSAIVISGVMAPLAAFAQVREGATGVDDPRDKKFQLVPCTGVDAQGNDTCDYVQLWVMINRLIKFLLYMSIPLVMGIIMWTAFKFITANGDPGKLVDAKKMLIPVAIGIFWVLGAWIIVYTVLDNLLTDEIDGQDRRAFLERFFNVRGTQ